MKKYYVMINFEFDEVELVAKPISIRCSYCDGLGKDYVEINESNDLIFIPFTKAIMNEHYYGIRQLLKDDFGVNVDNCELEIEKNL